MYEKLVQSLVPKHIIKNWSVTIEVTDTKNKNAPIYSFTGTPISNEISGKEAYGSGQYLLLRDNQIKIFQKPGTNHLFDYRIKFELDQEFEKNCLSVVNGQF